METRFGRDAQQAAEESSSFLKKRTKKLLPVASSARSNGQKFFASFFKKRSLPSCLFLLLASCAHDPLDTPIGWFHDLEGGAIAEQRPPPPGAGMPYPKIVTVPPKPTMPTVAYRNSLRDQLTDQRDRSERIAAHAPFAAPQLPAPPPAAKPATPAPGSPQPATPSVAEASLPTADAPPPAAAAPPPEALPADAPVFLAGAPLEDTAAASIPTAPPPPATFEGVPAEPLPTPPPPTPASLPAALRGADILFLPGEAILRQSQMATLNQIASARKGRRLEITGLGEAASDTPDGQSAAIELGLKRAEAVADGFASIHVPPAAISISAYAFGQGAEVRTLP